MTERQKEHVVRDICAEIGVAMIPLGPGSKEKKQVFESIAARLDLRLDPELPKPELAQAIVERAGLRWSPHCESAGDTITSIGLERVLDATRRLKERTIEPNDDDG